MNIGVPKEIKNNEYRVAIVPSGVRALTESGHRVLVQKSAGEGAGISDAEYEAAGAEMTAAAVDIYRAAKMIIKVKEPLPIEYGMLRPDQIIFTYLHLAPAPELTKVLLEQGVVGIAYETVQLENGSLPLLIPMSEIAGKLSVQVAAHFLEKQNGGSGVLLGGVPGVSPAEVVIIGGGTVGQNAAKIALGMGASVTLIDISLERLRYLYDILEGKITLLASNLENIERAVVKADVVIGGVLVPGAKAKKLVTRKMISGMRKGSVMVDVAIDQGGCFETSVATYFDNPVFLVDGVIHYCVSNMPGCVARTSTFALTNATLPYILKLANEGYRKALHDDLSLRKGLNVYQGKLINKPVAEAVGIECFPFHSAIKD
ncbi:MAG TPA: alanine dehydrogenase [Dehalococcoidales bacterium]|nr:alanine dehydrogenase [Dehalococcoidales bacterium]